MGIGTRHHTVVGKRKRSPPSSIHLPPASSDTQALSFEGALLSCYLPSPSIHWPSEELALACQRSLCDTMPSNPSPVASKRNSTVETLSESLESYHQENMGRSGSNSCSANSLARTVSPVSPRAFSCSSSSTIVESVTSVSPLKANFCHSNGTISHAAASKLAKTIPRPGGRSRRATESAQYKAIIDKPNARSRDTSLSTFKYRQCQPTLPTKATSTMERPLPPLPIEAHTSSQSKEISFMNWDSDDDDENDNSFPLSRVNAMLKRSLAELRPSSKVNAITPSRCSSHSRTSEGNSTAIKFGLSVVIEDPSPATSTANTARRNTQRPVLRTKRVVTDPESRVFSLTRGKSDKNHRSTIVGYESLYQLSKLRISRASAEETSGDANLQKDVTCRHESTQRTFKRRRLSKLSHWVRRHVSSSSK